mgnify:CR=1 FL=1
MTSFRASRIRISRELNFVALRLSGLLLAVLALGHFLITHILNDVSDTGSEFIGNRWSSFVWIIWDTALLVCCVIHALAGLLIVISDYVSDKGEKVRRFFLLKIAAVAVLLGGLFVLAVSLWKIYGMGK